MQGVQGVRGIQAWGTRVRYSSIVKQHGAGQARDGVGTTGPAKRNQGCCCWGTCSRVESDVHVSEPLPFQVPNKDRHTLPSVYRFGCRLHRDGGWGVGGGVGAQCTRSTPATHP